MLVSALSLRSGVSETKIRTIASTASKRYKVYPITKRGGGVRIIEHPSKELKAVQRWLSSFLLSKLHVHIAATAYSPDCSILKNARRHAHSNFTLRIDFENFFGSFRALDIYEFLRSNVVIDGKPMSDEDANFCASIFCRNGNLTIGAPSSPKLTNCMMFRFDDAVSRELASINLIYTRYADDIFVSSRIHFDHAEVISIVEKLAAGIEYLNLTINQKKTSFRGRRHRRSITGLILTPDRKISLGRAKKRSIQAQVHKFSVGSFPAELKTQLSGNIGFARDVEPSFVVALQRKYGQHVLDAIEGRSSVL